MVWWNGIPLLLEVLLYIPVTLVSVWLESLFESVAVMVHGVECLLHVNVSSFLAPYHLHNYIRPNITSLVDIILPLYIYLHNTKDVGMTPCQ